MDNILAIKKICKNEIITYWKQDEDCVVKRQYDIDGTFKKEKTLSLSELYCNRYFMDINRYFEYRINNDGYEEILSEKAHCCYGGECDLLDKDGNPRCFDCSVAASYNSMAYDMM